MVAGAISGAIEAVAVQPLDMIKTRFQLSAGHNPTLLQALRELLAEGGIPRLYRGLIPEMVGNMPTRSGLYAGKTFAANQLDHFKVVEGEILRDFLAGGFAGLPEAMATTPFQVVKVRMQNKANNALYRHDLDCFMKVLRSEGIAAFTTGFAATVGRNAVWNSVYFGSMAVIRSQMGPIPDGAVGELQRLTSGFFAGIFATCFNCPFDVTKSRIQGDAGATPKYKSTFQTMSLILKEEGPRSLWKGFAPKAWRMGCGGAVGIVAFEFVMRLLKQGPHHPHFEPPLEQGP